MKLYRILKAGWKNRNLVKGLLAIPGSTVPAVPILAGYSAIAMHRNKGISVKDIVCDGKKIVEAQIAVYKKFGVPVLSTQLDLTVTAEAIGAKVRYSDDSLPSIIHPATDPKIPDPRKDGRMPAVLDACREYEEWEGIIYGGCIEGPLTVASGVLGMEELMRKMVKAPEKIHELLAICSATSIEFGNAQLEEGALGLLVAEPLASSSVISPLFFSEFSFPYLRDIAKKLKSRIILHICGNTTPILGRIAKIPRLIGVSVDKVDLHKAKETIGRKILIGNVSITTLLNGTPQQVEKECMECIRKAGKGGMYILSAGCDVPPPTRDENIFALMKTAERFGRFPL
jgi:MtaA/CmuA family methyltransferase